MQAVIMAAGRSTRTWPLTVRTPKPLLPILNTPLLEHSLQELTGLVDEVIVVVHFIKERIIERFGREYAGMKITFVDQGTPLGTGHALMAAAAGLKDRFLVLNGDDLYAGVDLRALTQFRYAALAQDVDDARDYGAHVLDGDRIIEHVEKPKDVTLRRCNIGCYVFDRNVFDIKLNRSERGEFEITDYLSALARSQDVHSVVIRGHWLPMPFPWKVLGGSEALLRIKGMGPVVTGRESDLAQARLRGFVVAGDRCRVGESLVENSILMDDVQIGEGCVIRDSIVGNNVTIGERFHTRNEDGGRPISSDVKGRMLSTGRKALGVVVGDDVVIGDDVVTWPGVKIGPGRRIPAGQEVRADLGDGAGDPS